MLLSIVLLVISNTLLWTAVAFHLNGFELEGELRSFYFGIFLVGMILSIASVISGVARSRGKTKKKGIVELIISIIALVAFIAFLAFRLTIRFNQAGLAII